MMRPERGGGVAAGAAAGFAGGLFGVGGGLVLVPILTGRRFGLTQHQAHGTSLAVIGATAVVSIIVYALHGNVAWGTAAIVAVASAFTARWGARLATRTRSDLLARVFAAFLMLVAIRLLWGSGATVAPATMSPALTIASDLGIGALVGLLAGYMGVGGGIIAVPVFTLLLGMPQHLAQGTSLAVILVTAPIGALEHHRHGNVAVRFVPALAIGAAIGGPVASLLVQHVRASMLVRAFAALLLINAVNIWRRAGRKPAPAGPQALASDRGNPPDPV